jgi:hypothetical protein
MLHFRATDTWLDPTSMLDLRFLRLVDGWKEMAGGMWDDWLTWDRRYGVDAFERSEESLRHWCVIWDFAW